MEIPMKADYNGLDLYVLQCKNHILKPLAENYGIDTSDAAIRKAVDQHNKMCELIRAIGDFRKLDEPTITGYEYNVICLVSYVAPKHLIMGKLEETLEELKKRKPDDKPWFKARVEVVGSEVDDTDFIKKTILDDTFFANAKAVTKPDVNFQHGVPVFSNNTGAVSYAIGLVADENGSEHPNLMLANGNVVKIGSQYSAVDPQELDIHTLLFVQCLSNFISDFFRCQHIFLPFLKVPCKFKNSKKPTLPGIPETLPCPAAPAVPGSSPAPASAQHPGR
jgi:hypothetical protein